ncbi:hypothetical protein [Ochrobactrum sp. SFR4]|uniref:hypothetical protein n=1 Tax=Ochrobactrum sp. SFR4 TaxID=2717368 RepID=UPI001C8C581A|nr:hypothetical protein [Ochrobactrum sp. SFR4]MBX8827105.1 hypothetical protein [Ochrobactrum sp. SFR4]
MRRTDAEVKADRRANNAGRMKVPSALKGRALLLKYSAGLRIARTGAVSVLFGARPDGSVV